MIPEQIHRTGILNKTFNNVKPIASEKGELYDVGNGVRYLVKKNVPIEDAYKSLMH